MTVAVIMARDEADIIEHTVGTLIAQGVRVIVADNLSTDGTGLAASFAGAQVILDPDPAYRQSEKMTALAARHAHPGEWVIPADADEEWFGIALLTDDYDVAVAHPVVQIPNSPGWRDGETERYPKVAFRWQPGCVIEQGNHGVQGAGPRILEDALTVKHFQYRTLEQVTRKVRQGTHALEAAGLPEWSGTHWRDLARLSDDELAKWWTDYCRQSPP